MGTISKENLLPPLFYQKYIQDDMCTVSVEWYCLLISEYPLKITHRLIRTPIYENQNK